MVLDRWEHVLTRSRDRPGSLACQLDWVAKRRLIEAYRERTGSTGTTQPLGRARPAVPRRAAEQVAVQPAADGAARGATRKWPAPPSRRRRRGLFPRPLPCPVSPAIVAANWDSVVFDVGDDPLRRVPMMEPLKGTAHHVDTLFEGCDNPAELLSDSAPKER